MFLTDSSDFTELFCEEEPVEDGSAATSSLGSNMSGGSASGRFVYKPSSLCRPRVPSWKRRCEISRQFSGLPVFLPLVGHDQVVLWSPVSVWGNVPFC